jgi:hypothetical protein
MATVAQIQANRLNAQKSTGPRTTEGKERASQNAVKHGLLAREAVIQGEDPAEFEMYREGMLQTLAPVGPMEAMLAERVVGLSWRLRRAERLQNVAFAALDEGEPTELLEARLNEWKQHKGSERDRTVCGVLDKDAALGKAVVEDFAGARVMDRMLMYERRIESSLYRTMAELRKEREARRAATEPQEDSPSPGDPATGSEHPTAAELASFGANVAEEAAEAASAKRQASEAMCQVPSGRSDFPLRTSHFILPKITPHGVTTNGEERATRPGAETLPTSPFTLHDRSCETKPIAEEVSSLKCQVSSDGSDVPLQTSHSEPAPRSHGSRVRLP